MAFQRRFQKKTRIFATLNLPANDQKFTCHGMPSQWRPSRMTSLSEILTNKQSTMTLLNCISDAQDNAGFCNPHRTICEQSICSSVNLSDNNDGVLWKPSQDDTNLCHAPPTIRKPSMFTYHSLIKDDASFCTTQKTSANSQIGPVSVRHGDVRRGQNAG
jgi:hypothetical protein